MKIKRFNESVEMYDRDSMWSKQPDIIETDIISSKITKYLKSIREPIEYGENLLARSNLNYRNDEIPKIANLEKFEKLKNYIKSRDKLNKLNQKIENLKPELNKNYTEGASQFIFNIQRDLLLTDFDTFYELYNDDQIHPDILENYKATIADQLDLRKKSIKYNI